MILNRPALSSRQDTNFAVVPGQQRTTITPGPPTCCIVTRHCQCYPTPVPVATPQSPQVLEPHTILDGFDDKKYHHNEEIIVRSVCEANPTLSSCKGRCRQAQKLRRAG